jgi:anti-anti-sigma factor
MSFEVARADQRTAVVTISGELDLGNVDQVAAAVEPVIAGGLERLVLAVGGLRFADSSAIALWVRWSTRVPRIELHDPPPMLRRVLTTMGLAGRLGLEP